MTDPVLPATSAEPFFASDTSPAARALRVVKLCALLAALVLVGLASFADPAARFDTAVGFGVLVVLLLGPLWWMLRRLLRPGRAVLVLDEHGIESHLFVGRLKRHAWADLAGAEFFGNGNNPALELIAAGRDPGRRSALTGRRRGVPLLRLNVFDERSVLRLVAAIDRRIGVSRGASGHLAERLRAERDYRASLVALSPRTPATWCLVAANVLVWLALVVRGADPLDIDVATLLAWGGNTASQVQQGEWWRLLSAAFLHGGLMHLLVNMLGLAAIGITVERIYGVRQYLLIYLGAALSGSALSLHFAAQSGISVGASGAVFGVVGALLVAMLQHRDRVPASIGTQAIGGLVLFIGYSLLTGLGDAGIDNAAHIGGLVGGALLAWMLPERLDMPHFVATVRQRLALGVVLLLTGTALVVWMAPAATSDIARLIEMEQRLERATSAMRDFGEAIQAEEAAMERGDINMPEFDRRNRSIHSESARALAARYADIRFPEEDPREAFVRDSQRLLEIIAEVYALERVPLIGDQVTVPLDVGRALALAEEMQAVTLRLQRWAEQQRDLRLE